MKTKSILLFLFKCSIITGVVSLFSSTLVYATVIDVSIDGSDAIFLAGRTDVVIPPASAPWTTGAHLIRHSSPTPEEIQETLPPAMSVASGDIIRALDPAIGGISFFNGFGAPLYGPSGNGLSGSNLASLDGISGYIGPQGPLVGVFLDNTIPSSGPAPVTLDFSASDVGIDFLSLAPQLDQVFYIGDGVTSGGDFQTFIAPTGATRLFLGIPDGFGFVGLPGAYDDNDGSYRIRIGVNEVPINISEPTSIVLISLGLLGFTFRRLALKA